MQTYLHRSQGPQGLTSNLTALDLSVMAAYFGIVIAIGAHFGRQQKDPGDYFLGRNQLPWWAIMLSIVATETSALTVISIPGIGARGDLTFLQIPIGYIIGRIGVSAWLLPGYFEGSQLTAYSRLEASFGSATRKVTSALFMVIRSMGDSVRVFATAIPLAIVTGWSIPTSILVVAAVTVIYTWYGGLKAVVWIDVMQLCIYVVGGVATIYIASRMVGFGEAVSMANASDKLRTFDWQFSFSAPYTFFAALIGGALLSAASHGTDHLIVQRLLATRSLQEARRALIGSGFLVFLQFALFLFVGTMIWAAGADDPNLRGDELYATFIVNHLPSGMAGLMVAGILAAAMSTVSSSLNSLASAATQDFYAPIAKCDDPAHLLKVGRAATILWALVLAGGALSFRSSDQPVVVLALSVASITYGGLLGTFILSLGKSAVNQTDAIIGIAIATTSMLAIVFWKPYPFESLAWPWYVPLGTLITLTAAYSSLTVRKLGS
jgi:SSS family solute:Na+ symporter